MSQLHAGQRVVAEGTFLYDGLAECDIRIIFGPICYGCGDFDEESHMYEDVVRDTYYVEFGSTTERGVFNAGGGAFSTLEEAMSDILARPGIGSSVRWTKISAQQHAPVDGAAAPHRR